MSCDASKNNAPARRLRHLAIVLLAAMPLAAMSQVFYKWTDKDGKIQYADHPPTGFKGEVTRIELDPDSVAPPTPSPPRPNAAGDDLRQPPAVDVAKKRRELRAALEARVAQARARLAAAKSALEDGDKPQDDENQVIQQRFAKAQPGRSNCRAAQGADGKTIAVCPALVPGEAYYDRIGQLEDAVKQAEAALAAAEEAYRRGVD